MKQLQEIEKLATSIGKSLQGVKLSDISKGGKDAANLEKINAQTQLLIEKTKLLEQQREKAAISAEAAMQKLIVNEEKIAAATQKRQEAQRKSSQIVVDSTNYELQAMNKYYAELEKSSAANEKARKSTADYKVGASALANVEKLNAIITSEHTTSLQKLDAQIRLNVLDAQKYVAAGDTQNANYLKLIANTKQLS